MDYPDDEFPGGDRQPPRRDHRNQKSPPPLKVNRGSHKIRKPPFPPPPPPPPPPPVIIYVVPPEVHHADPAEFMGLVQRLTGQPPPGPSAAMFPSPDSERTTMPLGDYSANHLAQINMSGYGASSSRPGSAMQQQGSFPPGPGPSVFEMPVQDQRPLIRQQQYPDYNYMAPSSSANEGFVSHGQLTHSNSSNDLMNTIEMLFPQQEDDHDLNR